VDLAGSERLKRSMVSQVSNVNDGGPLPPSKSPRDSPRDLNAQRKEAGAINKSLAQLALVIQRISSGGSLRHVPYRDSMLTRLLADSFGGSSKTCLIITCSSLERDREETRGTLEFGKRAGLVRNVAQINIEMAQEPSEVVKALLAKELAEMTKEKEALQLDDLGRDLGASVGTKAQTYGSGSTKVPAVESFSSGSSAKDKDDDDDDDKASDGCFDAWPKHCKHISEECHRPVMKMKCAKTCGKCSPSPKPKKSYGSGSYSSSSIKKKAMRKAALFTSKM